MSPKPGFWYYDSVRAFRVYLVLGLFAVGVHLSKVGSPSLVVSWSATLHFFIQIFILLVLSLLIVLLFVAVFRCLPWRRLFQKAFPRRDFSTSRIREPHPYEFERREEFLEALREYGTLMGYKPGWVFYRSHELWPIHGRFAKVLKE
ncbi:MAG: hypothetical protein KDD64_07275 [Bdellovibrionales bacterium]|nr:hypothetical protein [Bdellovibrionales bacterium]